MLGLFLKKKYICISCVEAVGYFSGLSITMLSLRVSSDGPSSDVELFIELELTVSSWREEVGIWLAGTNCCTTKRQKRTL